MSSHSNRGMGLEKTVKTLFKHYEEKNIFCHNIIVEQQEGIYVNKAPFDFIAYYNSCLYAFDTKECHSGSLAISNFKLHQRKALHDVVKQGGYGFFMVYFYKVKQLERIDVEEVERLIQEGSKSVSPDPRRKIKLDFLGVL